MKRTMRNKGQGGSPSLPPPHSSPWGASLSQPPLSGSGGGGWVAGKAELKVKEVCIILPASSAAGVFLPVNQDVDALVSKCQWG